MKKNILIADDDDAIVDALQMMLELENYTVHIATNPQKILDMKDHYPDVILLDIWMSGQDGRDICKNLKQDPKTKHIPIILISASRDIIKSAEDAGANDFIAKPFEMSELLEKVRRFTKE